MTVSDRSRVKPRNEKNPSTISDVRIPAFGGSPSPELEGDLSRDLCVNGAI
jgi:hypothetical protein